MFRTWNCFLPSLPPSVFLPLFLSSFLLNVFTCPLKRKPDERKYKQPKTNIKLTADFVTLCLHVGRFTSYLCVFLLAKHLFYKLIPCAVSHDMVRSEVKC